MKFYTNYLNSLYEENFVRILVKQLKRPLSISVRDCAINQFRRGGRQEDILAFG